MLIKTNENKEKCQGWLNKTNIGLSTWFFVTSPRWCALFRQPWEWKMPNIVIEISTSIAGNDFLLTTLDPLNFFNHFYKFVISFEVSFYKSGLWMEPTPRGPSKSIRNFGTEIVQTVTEKSEKTGVAIIFKKLGHSRSLFSLFSSFLQLTVNMFIVKSCWWLDSNRRPLVSEPTALPTEPQPLP